MVLGERGGCEEVEVVVETPVSGIAAELVVVSVEAVAAAEEVEEAWETLIHESFVMVAKGFHHLYRPLIANHHLGCRGRLDRPE